MYLYIMSSSQIAEMPLPALPVSSLILSSFGLCLRSMPETDVYVRDVQSRTTSASERARAIVNVVWENRVKLAGTAGSWFILVRRLLHIHAFWRGVREFVFWGEK